MYEGISNFASISKGQADQTQQVAQGSQKMSELAAKLTELALNLQ